MNSICLIEYLCLIDISHSTCPKLNNFPPKFVSISVLDLSGTDIIYSVTHRRNQGVILDNLRSLTQANSTSSSSPIQLLHPHCSCLSFQVLSISCLDYGNCSLMSFPASSLVLLNLPTIWLPDLAI